MTAPADACVCVPCSTPGCGAPVLVHCAACCYGSLVAEYDHACPVEGHRQMAVLQYGPLPCADAS